MNILLDGIFYNGHGMAEGNRILLRILSEAGHRVRIVPRDRRKKHLVLSSKEVDYIASFENTKLKSKDLYLYNYVGWKAQPRDDYAINIARTTFETDRLPDGWVKQLNKFDEVWVQCKFNLHTFRSSGIKVPLRLIPNFFDHKQYSPKGKKLSLPVSKSFKFLSIFDLKDNRKGYDILLRAYLNEFSAKDDVALVIKIRTGEKKHKLQKLIDTHSKKSNEQPVIHSIDEMLSTPDFLSLYRSCNAFVLPTRGEGWGRPFYEAMLMEMPVIGTNWSGQTDFMKESNSFPIKVERLVRIENNPKFRFYNGHRWAEPSIKDLQAKMRFVFSHEKEAEAKGRQARKDLLKQYRLDKMVKKVTRVVDKFRK